MHSQSSLDETHICQQTSPSILERGLAWHSSSSVKKKMSLFHQHCFYKFSKVDLKDEKELNEVLEELRKYGPLLTAADRIDLKVKRRGLTRKKEHFDDTFS